MTQISSAGRAIAEQIIASTDNFASGLNSSISAGSTGNWSSGKLWDQAILSMRTQAGGLAQNLEFLKLLGDDVLKLLPTDLSGQLDDQLKAVKKILDEIHTDRGGEFAGNLTNFRTYGDNVSTKLKEILKAADEADASAARTAVEGAQVIDFNVVGNTGAQTVKETAKAAENVLTHGAGGM